MKRIFQMRITRWTINLAIIAGFVVVTMNWVKAKNESTYLKTELKQLTAAHKKNDVEFFAKINDLKGSLNEAVAQTEKAEGKVAIQNEQIATLSASVAKATHEKDEAKAALARYEVTGLQPEQIAAVAEESKKLKAELAAAQEKIRSLTSKSPTGTGSGGAQVSLPSNLRSRVLVVDPKWHFVVLDAGQEKGVVENGELFVTRNGRLIAKVVVSSVDKQRCIANVVPGWEFGDVLEGDSVAPVRPKS